MALNLAKFKTDLGTALKEAAALNDKDNVAKGIAVSVEPSSGQGSTTGTGSGSGSLS